MRIPAKCHSRRFGDVVRGC